MVAGLETFRRQIMDSPPRSALTHASFYLYCSIVTEHCSHWAPRFRPKDAFIRIRFYGDGFGVNYVHPASLPKRRRHSREMRLRTCLWLTDGWWRTLWVCEDGRLGNLLGAFGLRKWNLESSDCKTQSWSLWILQHLFYRGLFPSCLEVIGYLVTFVEVICSLRAGWAEWKNLWRAQRLNRFLIFVWILKPLKALHGWKGLNWAPLKAFGVPVTCWRGL